MMVLLLYSTRYGGEKGKSKLHACTLKYFAEPFLLPVTIAICEVSLLKVPDSSSQHWLRTFRTIVPFFIHATRGPFHCLAANSVFFTDFYFNVIKFTEATSLICIYRNWVLVIRANNGSGLLPYRIIKA